MTSNLTVMDGHREPKNERLGVLIERVRNIIRNMQLDFQPQTVNFFNEKGSYTPDDVAGIAWIEYGKGSERQYKIAAREVGLAMQRRVIEQIKEPLLSPDDDAITAGQAELVKLIKLLAHPSSTPEELKYYAAAWAQIIWQVKRKMRGLKTGWDLMLCLYGKQGTGKSSIVREFGKPLRCLYLPQADFSLFSDKFRLMMLHTNYLICMDEMPRADKTEINLIKQVITADTLQARRIYSSQEVSVTRNASFIATTNHSIIDSVTDTTGMRRFVQMRCRDQGVNDAFIRALDAIDFSLLWCAQTGTAEEAPPVERDRELFAGQQQELEIQSDFDYWYDNYITVTGDEADTEPNKTLHEHFKRWCEGQGRRPVSIQKFPQKMRDRLQDKCSFRQKNAIYFSGIRLNSEEI